MTINVIAMGLFVTLVAVIWMAMVLWGLVSPRAELESEAPVMRRQPRQQRSPSSVPDRRRDVSSPVVFAPKPLEPSHSRADNIVSLAEWREERARRTG